MGYEHTRATCPVCGYRGAEYNSIDDILFCPACSAKERELREKLGDEEYNKIRVRVEAEDLERRRVLAREKRRPC